MNYTEVLQVSFIIIIIIIIIISGALAREARAAEHHG